jgi:hypothetical protein
MAHKSRLRGDGRNKPILAERVAQRQYSSGVGIAGSGYATGLGHEGALGTRGVGAARSGSAAGLGHAGKISATGKRGAHALDTGRRVICQ